MLRLTKRLLSNRRGATAVEYAILASLTAVLLYAGFQLLGGNLAANFDRISALLAP